MRLQGLVYRAHNPRWAFAPDSGAGASRHGGRFNPKGTPALYMSLHLETAWLEAQQGFPFKGQPMTMVAYRVDCDDLVDLTDPAGLAGADAAPTDLACPWEAIVATGATPPSWRLATRLIAAGAAGLLVPSFAVGATERDVNVVFWRWSPERPHRVEVVDDDRRLPRDDRSWR